MITVEPGCIALVIPGTMVAEFKEVIRRGMAFDFENTADMHQFADTISKIEPPSMTPTGSNSPKRPFTT